MFENYLRNFIVPVLIEFDFLFLLKIYRIEESPLHSNSSGSRPKFDYHCIHYKLFRVAVNYSIDPPILKDGDSLY